jgi:hypothetical protein
MGGTSDKGYQALPMDPGPPRSDAVPPPRSDAVAATPGRSGTSSSLATIDVVTAPIPAELAQFLVDLGEGLEARAIRAAADVAAAAGLVVGDLLPAGGAHSSEWDTTVQQPGTDPVLLRATDAAGRPLVIAVIAFDTPVDERGHATDVKRLLDAIESALGRWQFMVHVRRAVPAGFDPEAVARAVHMWRIALDRGDWKGRHAVYEDDDVGLDLTVLSQIPGEGVGGAVAIVPPLPASDRVSAVYRRVIEAVHGLEEVEGDLPWVAVVVASPKWRLPRGTVCDLLYGLPDRVHATNERGAIRHEAAYHPTGMSVFSDPACRRLHGLWWLELSGTALRGQAHENPWAIGELQSVFPGPRFAVVARGDAKGNAELAWSAP